MRTKRPETVCGFNIVKKLKMIDLDRSVEPINDRYQDTFGLATGDFFEFDSKSLYAVIGVSEYQGKRSLSCMEIKGNYLKCFSHDELRRSIHTLFPKDAQTKHHELRPTTYPDLFLVINDKNGATIRKPCHRGMVAEFSRRMSDEIRNMKPGEDLKLPEEEFTEEVLDEFISVIYDCKEPDLEIITLKTLLEWGCFRILDRIHDLTIDQNSIVSITEAITSGDYGRLDRLRMAVIKYLKE